MPNLGVDRDILNSLSNLKLEEGIHGQWIIPGTKQAAAQLLEASQSGKIVGPSDDPAAAAAASAATGADAGAAADAAGAAGADGNTQAASVAIPPAQADEN